MPARSPQPPDPASSEFRRGDGLYHVAGRKLTSAAMIARYAEMVERFPVWLIEDGLADDDSAGWATLTERGAGRVQLVGDDIFVTNAAIIAESIGRGVANSALIKLDQIGTVTETLEAMATCRRRRYAQLVSHRSGETTGSFIADLATGSGRLRGGFRLGQASWPPLLLHRIGRPGVRRSAGDLRRAGAGAVWIIVRD